MGQKFRLNFPERLWNHTPSVPPAQRCHWNVELKMPILAAATSLPPDIYFRMMDTSVSTYLFG